MVSVCLPSNGLLQHLPSYLGCSYLRRGDISSRLLQQSTATAPYLGWGGYLLTTIVPDLQRGIAPLGPPVPAQPLLLGLLLLAAGPSLRLRMAPQGHRPWPGPLGGSSQLSPQASGSGWLLRVTDPGLGHQVASPSCPWPRTWGVSSWPPLTLDVGCLLPATAGLWCRVAPPGRRPDLGCRVSPLGRPWPQTQLKNNKE